MVSSSETLICVQEEEPVAEIPAKNQPSGGWHVVYGAAIFLGAFLLFQVELILGKLILPWFGGTPAVWTACLLVFQLLLLAGYSYARLFALKLSARSQGSAHLLALGGSLLLLVFLAFVWPTPITPGENWRPNSADNPTWFIVRFLLAGIGFPFLILATTGPLLQHWFAQEHPEKSPYRLYSLSNLGSLIGLLSYPLLLEPFLRLHTQVWTWTAIYLVFAGICASCALSAYRSKDDRATPFASRLREETVAPSLSQYLLWTAL